jgi:NAD(P)-dependent dehydrogenase (short-subunit alcohol dehydrogenase family)
MKNHALVTGASRGIGLAIASILLDNRFKVTGTSRSGMFPKPLSDHKSFSGLVADLGKDDGYNSLTDIFSGDDAVNVLINNAGIFQEADLSSDDDNWMDVWDQTMQVNLKAPATLSKKAITAWLKSGSEGIVINIASRAAYRGDTQEYAAYAASKGALVAFTKSISREMGKKGITAFSVAPGFVETDMAKESIDVYGAEYLKKDLSFDDLTQPANVADLVYFLASGKARHMTGTTFHINGGSYLV